MLSTLHSELENCIFWAVVGKDVQERQQLVKGGACRVPFLEAVCKALIGPVHLHNESSRQDMLGIIRLLATPFIPNGGH